MSSPRVGVGIWFWAPTRNWSLQS